MNRARHPHEPIDQYAGEKTAAAIAGIIGVLMAVGVGLILAGLLG